MEHIVTLCLYPNAEHQVIANSYSQAKQMAIVLSALIPDNWTRPRGIKGPIEHANFYSDIYNQGELTIKQL